MNETGKKMLASAAKKGRRAVIAVTAGAILAGTIGYASAAGIEDIFDERYYADTYPDLKAAYGYDRAALLKHFKKYGLSEGRNMNEMIDIVKYREKYPDLEEAFGDDWDAYIEHYLTYGAFEDRDNGTSFDAADYLERYGDLKETFGDDILAAYKHYKEYGKHEGREARSEEVVRAESGWAPEPENGDDDEAPPLPTVTEEPSQPTEQPVTPTEAPLPTEAPAEPTEQPAQTEAPAQPTEQPDQTEAPAQPTEQPDQTETPVQPTEEPSQTEAPFPTEAPIPTEEPIPTESPLPTEEPIPTESPLPTEQPVPTQSPLPTGQPTPTETPLPTEVPLPTAAPTEQPVPTEAPVPTEEPSTPAEFVIQSVEVVSKGFIRVTLNQKTEQPLTLGAFSIICNDGGSAMTIQSVSTKDNMVYDLTTAYYRDQKYDIQITLPDGTAISSVFEYRTDCAQIEGIHAVRRSATEAEIVYNSNEPGTFYYILSENGQGVARLTSFLMEVAETVDGTAPTEAELKERGIKTDMKQHQNTITVTGLTEGVPYMVYYMAVNTEGKSTLVDSFSIDGEAYVETAEAIQSAKAFEEKQANGEFLYGFQITLKKATEEALTLDQFDISCPKNETKLGQVKTVDNKVYRVYMERGTIPKGNNTYTILITLKDKTQLKGTCYLDLQAPQVSIWDFEWVDTDTVKVTVNSDEAGILHYAIQDEVEGAGTIEGKDPSQIYINGVKVEMGYGLNYITVKGVKEGQWFCCASEDAQGNKEAFFTYKQIPAYTAPDPDEEKWPKISLVEVMSDTKLKVVFDKSLDGFYYENTETQISGLTGKPLFEAAYGSEGSSKNNVLTITIRNLSMSEGKHTLTIVLYGPDEDNYFTIPKTLTYDFTR